MNRVISIAAIVALVTSLSFADEKSIKYGVRAAFNMNDYSSGNKTVDKDINMGMGVSGGLLTIAPISGNINFRIGAEFHFRTLYDKEFDMKYYDLNGKEYDAKYEEDITEFAISIPVVVAYSLGGAWAGAGWQIDLPIGSERSMEMSGTGEPDYDGKESENVNKRSMDFGIAIGAGYNITSNIGVDLKAVIGLTNITSKSDDKSSMNQYGVGISYLF
ncbi:MAG: PorT family protein [Fibromonadaceae bacterium]|nr:PorT family protein [Fibromonadaceae bacterium]